VLVSGEPGLGKSRIAAALGERLHPEPHLRLRYFCSPYHQDSALYPFVDQLGRAAGFALDDPPAAKLEKLEALLARAMPPEEDVAFLADLVSLPASERHPMPNLSPQRKKERTLEALIRQLKGSARRRPVVMVFEDAHWIDPTSREVLDFIVERVRNLSVLLLVTFRPEFQPWLVGADPRHAQAPGGVDDRKIEADLVEPLGEEAREQRGREVLCVPRRMAPERLLADAPPASFLDRHAECAARAVADRVPAFDRVLAAEPSQFLGKDRAVFDPMPVGVDDRALRTAFRRLPRVWTECRAAAVMVPAASWFRGESNGCGRMAARSRARTICVRVPRQ
jgi:hypothetical protein